MCKKKPGRSTFFVWLSRKVSSTLPILLGVKGKVLEIDSKKILRPDPGLYSQYFASYDIFCEPQIFRHPFLHVFRLLFVSFFLAFLKRVSNSCYAFGCQRKSSRDWLKENFETWPRSVLTILCELWHFLWNTNFQTSNSQHGFAC